MNFLTHRLNHIVNFATLFLSTALSLTFIPGDTSPYLQFPVITTTCNSPERTVQVAEFVDSMRFDTLTVRKRLQIPSFIPTSLTGPGGRVPSFGNRPESRIDHHPANGFISSALLVPLRI